MRRVRLSSIELAIVKGLANGMQSKELATILNRSTGTVELHIRTLFAKFDARSRAQLVARAIYEGVIDSCDADRVGGGTIW